MVVITSKGKDGSTNGSVNTNRVMQRAKQTPKRHVATEIGRERHIGMKTEAQMDTFLVKSRSKTCSGNNIELQCRHCAHLGRCYRLRSSVSAKNNFRADVKIGNDDFRQIQNFRKLSQTKSAVSKMVPISRRNRYIG